MPASHRGSVKGSVVLSRLSFVRSHGGPECVERVLARLSPDDRKLLASTMQPGAWYPFEMNAHLDAAIATELKNGDRIFRLLGAASARHNLASTDQQRFVRERNPHALLEQASAIYGVYYDTGHRWYERVSDTKAILRTAVSLSFSIEDCLTVVGWHETAIEMCGGRDVKVDETQCRARGDAVCEYVCQWT